MIVKIWPIKADYKGEKGKVGGAEGVKNAVEYIMDQEKVIASRDDLKDFMPYDRPDGAGEKINLETDCSRVVSYMANEDKTLAKYISTYLCNSKNVPQEFQLAAELLAVKSGFRVTPGTGAMAFHMVQSFPENLDISNEEVHECGLELVRKIKKHQALICSHVHPVKMEDGEIHGRCKHNHILLNAYIHPDFYDPERGGPGKYNDCTETYRQLQVYNDEIAIEHGLPIIRQADMERKYSWLESDAKNKGTSWKERVRMDIEMCRGFAKNWEEFVRIMGYEGYTIRERKHVTYTTPKGYVVRAGTLGSQFTKESLELHWAIRDHAKTVIEKDLSLNEEPILSDFVYHYPETLSVRIPVGPQFIENRQFVYLPINKDTRANEEALRSYMAMKGIYDICNPSGQVVTTASGIEILRSIEDLKDEGRMKYREKTRMDEAKIREERQKREAEKAEEESKKRLYYYNEKFKNSRYGWEYRTYLYDEEGRSRSWLELIFVLALVVLQKESYLWIPEGDVPDEQKNEVFFSNTNKKLQLMIECGELSRQENIESPTQLEKRLNLVGADLSRTKKAYYNVSNAVDRMEPLAKAILQWRETKEIVEKLNALPEGSEKDALRKEYAEILKKYKAAKHAMYVGCLSEENQIAEFEARYSQISADMEELDKRRRDYTEQYSRLKKLEYGLQHAQNSEFIYGPSYSDYQKQVNEGKEKQVEHISENKQKNIPGYSKEIG